MSAVTVPTDLPPMLARMQSSLCSWGKDCPMPATVEVMMLWPRHQDENLITLAKLHMRPLCEDHLASERSVYGIDVDGSMLIVRRLALGRNIHQSQRVRQLRGFRAQTPS